MYSPRTKTFLMSSWAVYISFLSETVLTCLMYIKGVHLVWIRVRSQEIGASAFFVPHNPALPTCHFCHHARSTKLVNCNHFWKNSDLNLTRYLSRRQCLLHQQTCERLSNELQKASLKLRGSVIWDWSACQCTLMRSMNSENITYILLGMRTPHHDHLKSVQ